MNNRVINKKVLKRIRVNSLKYNDKKDSHNLKHSKLLMLLLERMTEEKNWKGRQKLNYEDQIMMHVECKSYRETEGMAQNRNKWRSVTPEDQLTTLNY